MPKNFMDVSLRAIPVLILCAQSAAAQSDWIEIPLEEGTFDEIAGEYRHDVIDIPLAPFGELEYKLALEEGDTIVYEWNVLEIEDPELLYSEFHGHTERVGNAPGTLMFYRIHSDGRESGRLTAPFDGIHGWYLNNTSAEDVTVELHVAGFFADVEEPITNIPQAQPED